MRRIIHTLKEYRKASLSKMQWEDKSQLEAKLNETNQMFEFVDANLSGIMFANDGRVQDASSKLAEVMISADFTFAIMEFVQRQLWPGYQRRMFDFEPLVFADTVPNFLPVTRYQKRAGVDDLEYVGEKGEARTGSVDDATKRQYRVYKWEKQYDFSFEAIVNDDLGYLNEQASDMGVSARRSLEKFVSRMIFNATNIARLVALGANFNTTGRLTSDRISTARMAFAQRTDARAEPMLATLKYIVHHTGLIDTIRTIQNSQLVPELATNAANVIANDFVPIENPFLAGTAPTLPWMAMSDPNGGENIRGLVLARRQGLAAPMVLRKRSDVESFASFNGGGGAVSPAFGDFATGDIMLKVHDEWGTYIDGTDGNMVDTNGFYYSAATAA